MQLRFLLQTGAPLLTATYAQHRNLRSASFQVPWPNVGFGKTFCEQDENIATHRRDGLQQAERLSLAHDG